MFISYWLEVSGIDKIIAPIESNNASDDEIKNTNGHHGAEESALSDFWDIVAPRAPPPQSNHPKQSGSCVSNDVHQSSSVALVECQHCHKMTSIHGVKSNTNTTTIDQQQQPTTPATHKTPNNTPSLTTTTNNSHDSIFETTDIPTEQSILHAQVLAAAQETAITSSGPTFLWEDKHKLFSYCAALPKSPKKGKDGKLFATKLGANGEPVKSILKSKNIKKISKLLSDKPQLVLSRSANMAGLPDGSTVLHAACHVGNEEVVGYLLKRHVRFCGDDIMGNDDEPGGDGGGKKERPMLDSNERDVQGRTALDIAADQGHIEVIPMFKMAYDSFQLGKERERKRLVQESDISSNDDNDVEEPELTDEMAKLSTCDSANTATPKVKWPKPQQSSHSPTRSYNRMRTLLYPHLSEPPSSPQRPKYPKTKWIKNERSAELKKLLSVYGLPVTEDGMVGALAFE